MATPKFIADINVGKLARWLRIMGYDTLLFRDGDDSAMVELAAMEDRVILTRDTRIIQRRVVASGRVKMVLIQDDELAIQLKQVASKLNLTSVFKPFVLCLECNEPLVGRKREEIKDRVPPYVYKIQDEFMECPNCHRIYWKGTHWQAMTERLTGLMSAASGREG
ncbi:MAG: Mut7-C RNAse domain-containing protein [Chloroflexota bacterium]